jgi:hypothetical protein
MKRCHWVKPVMVCQIKFTEPRLPQLILKTAPEPDLNQTELAPVG